MLPTPLEYAMLKLDGDCYNMTISVTYRNAEDFVPTTTIDPLVDYNLAVFDAARASSAFSFLHLSLS